MRAGELIPSLVGLHLVGVGSELPKGVSVEELVLLLLSCVVTWVRERCSHLALSPTIVGKRANSKVSKSRSSGPAHHPQESRSRQYSIAGPACGVCG